MRSAPRVRTLAAALTALAGLHIGASALAQCNVYRPNLPDLDQRREFGPGVAGLPWDGGSHCIPTSVADIVAYMSNHGAPELTGNVSYNWQNPASYNIATSMIDSLGVAMLVDEGGTSFSAGAPGLQTWLDLRAPGKFVVTTRSWRYNDPASPFGIAQTMLAGGFPILARGTYEWEASSPFILERTGGHILAVRNVYDACGPAPEVGLRDPNTQDSKQSNDVFRVYREHLNLVHRNFRLDNGTAQTRYYYEFTETSTSAKKKILDSYLTITPMFAVVGPVEGQEAGVSVIRPGTLTGPIQHQHVEQIWSRPGSGVLKAVELSPDGHRIYALVDRTASEPGALFGMDLNGNATQLLTIPESVMGCAVGADGSVRFVRGDVGGVWRIHRYLPQFDNTLAPGGQATCIGRPLAMTTNDRDDSTILLTMTTGGRLQLETYSRDPSPGPSLPPTPVVDLTLDPETTTMSMGWTGTLLLTSDASVGCIYRLGWNANGGLVLLDTIPLPPGSSPRDPQETSTGSILYTSNGRFYETSFRGGVWVATGDLGFAPFPAGLTMDIPRLRSGGDDILIGGVTTFLENERLDGAPDCPADLNDDGQADFFDYLDFARAFSDGSPRADFNEDGQVDFFDYLDFAAAFDEGC
jgi:hypothetical protein